MSNVIDSLLVALGFQIDDSELKEFKQEVADARENLMMVVGAAAAAAGAIGLFVAKIASGIDDLGDFAETEQVAVEMLQEVGYAAQLTGSSLEAVKSSVSGLNRTMGEAILGIGRGAATFEKLHLSARNADGSVKTIDEMLGDVADKMQGMSRQESIALAEKLGIDRSMITLLSKGREELERYRAEARAFGVTTEEDAKIAGEFQDSMDRTQFMVGALAKRIAVGLMPRMREMLDKFREWVMTHKDIIKERIDKVLDVTTMVIGKMWDVVVGLVDALGDAVKWLGQFEIVTNLARAALLILISAQIGKGLETLATLIRGAVMAMAGLAIVPILIGAVVLALGLLIEDFMTFRAGGGSVIGDLVAQFPGLLDVINMVEAGAREFFGFLGELWGIVGPPLLLLMGALWQLLTTVVSLLWPPIRAILIAFGQTLAAIIPIVAEVISGIAIGAAQIVAFLTEIATGVVSAIDGAINIVADTINYVVDLITSAYNQVMGFVDGIVGFASKVGKALGMGNATVTANINQAPARTGQLPAANARVGMIGKASDVSNSRSTFTTTNHNTVHAPITITGGDPVQTARAVSREMARAHQQTTRNGQTAVDH